MEETPKYFAVLLVFSMVIGITLAGFIFTDSYMSRNTTTNLGLGQVDNQTPSQSAVVETDASTRNRSVLKEKCQKNREYESLRGNSIEGRNTEDRRATSKRYINKYEIGSPSTWILEEGNFSANDPETYLYEVTRYPNAELTTEDLELAWELYNKSYEAAEVQGWFSFNQSKKDGYEKFDPIHYANICYYINEGNLNPYAPETMVYYPSKESSRERTLAGYMYLTSSLEEEGEQIAGPLTVWHYHPTDSKDCFVGMPSQSPEGVENVGCSEDETKMFRSPEMLHVWFIKHPGGPFSSRMRIPDRYMEKINGSKPDKMSKKEFKDYARSSYENGSG